MNTKGGHTGELFIQFYSAAERKNKKQIPLSTRTER